MGAGTVDIPFLSNISFMLTYKCTIACPHCIVNAGPNRKEEMDAVRALDWIDQAAAYDEGKVRGLALTGGEPFYNIDHLSRISGYAREKGLITSVVTNAFWAKEKQPALEALNQVPAIDYLSISTDVHHQRFIPIDNIRNAVWAARETGRQYNIAICTDNEESPEYQAILRQLATIVTPDEIRIAVTYPAGRALKHHDSYHHKSTATPTVSACTMASAPVVYPDGNVMACIGPVLTLPGPCPLRLGNLNENSLETILDKAEINPLLQIIRIWGPAKLVSLLNHAGKTDLLPGEYISNSTCDICYKLFSDERIIEELEALLRNRDYLNIIAYARMHYLQEPAMVQALGLDGRETIDCGNVLLSEEN
jgi:organic radical activating enzyme